MTGSAWVISCFMFFYISFLRPPPRTADVLSLISITPQVANDLRTLYLNDANDIFYAWLPSIHAAVAASVPSTTKKLTTWRESSAYKSLTIPLPSNAKAGQTWRLALTANADANFVINLTDGPFGTRPLPVISMPVQLLEEQGRKTGSLAKQEQIERLYAIPGSEPGKSSTFLCICEQTSYDLDKKIWDGGLGLSSWLSNVLLAKPGDDSSIRFLNTVLVPRRSDNGLRVLELGAGTGIVSICLSALLEKLQDATSIRVLATDLYSAMELIDHNIKTNEHLYPTLTLEASVLDWNEETLPAPAQGPVDLLVMADVTYNTASFPALVRTLDTLIKSSQTSMGGRTPSVLLAYKQRDPSERELWPMLRDIGIHLNLIDRVKGAGPEAVEIWFWNESSVAKA